MIGYIDDKKKAISAYQPPQEVRDITAHAQKDFENGFNILNESAVELNNYSVIERMNKDQRTFNALVDESVENPMEAWKWRGTRSTARKKTMAMHAHLTAEYVVPEYFPDNEGDKMDREVGEVMGLGVEWMTIHSNYRPTFLLAAQGMLVNPVTYLSADYCEVYQRSLHRADDGYEEVEVLDEVLSGFNADVMSADQVLITNRYVQNIQRQRCIIKRRYLDYKEAEAKYGEHPNWQYVQPGIKAIFNSEDGLFYNVKDDEHLKEVEEAIHQCRREDCEEPYVNGVYMGNDNVEFNPIKHRDNQDNPKYNIVPFGYQRINEHYFFWKSLVNLVGWDDRLIDAMYEVQMNSEFLGLEAPVAYSGYDKVDGSVVYPGGSIASSNPDAKVTPILPRPTGNGYRAIEFAEQSASDESLSPTEMGQLPDASQKAFTVGQAAQNAQILVGSARKSLAQSVMEFGYLMGDIFINHFTVAQLDEITGNLKYRELLLQDQMVNGRKVSKKVRFDSMLSGLSEKEKKGRLMKILTDTGYPNHKEDLIIVNPLVFSKLKYLCRCEPDALEPKNKEYAKQVIERVYALTRQDPNANPSALLRKLYATYYPRETDELMAQMSQQIMGLPDMGGGAPQQGMAGNPVQPKQLATQTGQKVGY